MIIIIIENCFEKAFQQAVPAVENKQLHRASSIYGPFVDKFIFKIRLHRNFRSIPTRQYKVAECFWKRLWQITIWAVGFCCKHMYFFYFLFFSGSAFESPKIKRYYCLN